MSNTVPEGWKLECLGSQIGKITSGGTPKAGNPDYYDGSIPFLKIDDITSVKGRHVKSSKNTITEKALKESSAKLFPTGTVVATMYGTIGATAILSKPMATNQAIAAFLSPKGFTPDYLYQLLSFEAPKLASNASQTTQANISATVLKEFEVLVPPLPEQNNIAAILSSVDNVIEKTSEQIDKLKDLKTGMMQKLLTKGIGHTEFKDSPAGRIPASWGVRYISDLCSHIVDCVNKTAPVVEHVTPYKMIRTTNVRNGRIVMDGMRYVNQETFQSWSRRLALRADDLIFTREAPVGECGLLSDAKGLFLGQRTMVYRAAPDKLDAGFLLWSMLSEYCQSQIEDLSGGSTTPHLRVPDCGKILLKVPPLAEQREISNAIQSVATMLDQKEQAVGQLLGLKKALMQDLLTGKVRVKVDQKESAVA